ncbi:hypothetical protein [Fusobacterium sp. FSA-380-WT-3A]|uniref:hypothetical protein n=1 Tax=Fusobacterium sp. FSA-380-WT-3A TaxID=2725304 RepID=UPI0014776832|nr:hypothetical protein [Fusobacterium sp. FSA-380-WT-3A]NME36502.1 hypothetical protein [Fusobacterium sp. FSA-380-WT-3A]
MNIEFIKFIATIFLGIFTGYKYIERELNKKASKIHVQKEIESILKEVDKKVDKILYDREVEFLRSSIEENSKNLSSKLEEMREDMKIIKEYLLKKD